MSLTIPPVLKKISPFIKRAEELDKDTSAAESRIVAYYCRQYAVHLGIQLAGSAPEGKACLGDILGDLEKEKAAMDNFTKDEAGFLCRKFAYSVFDKADAEDRAGNAGKATAKTFYAAVSFLEILSQFSSGEEDEQATEDKKKIMYSKWKATDILKALKEGRTPKPGGYGEEEMKEEKEDSFDLPAAPEPFVPTPAPNNEDVLPPPVDTVVDRGDSANERVSPMTVMPPPPVAMPPPPPEEPLGDEEGTEIFLGPPPTYPGEAESVSFEPTQKSASSTKSGIFGFGSKKPKSNKAQIQDATELTRFALAALEDKDADLAAERLKKALSVLGR